MQNITQGSRMINMTKMIMLMLKHRYFSLCFDEILHRFYSTRSLYVLRRDLAIPFQTLPAKVALILRELREDDKSFIFGINSRIITSEEAKERIRRHYLLESKIKTCYVGITEDNKPCYVQWLIGPEENEKVRTFYPMGFPPLAKDEMLLEGAYTPVPYRGQGIMAHAMSKIAQIGGNNGARWISTVVNKSNIPSLRGCKRAGFAPFMMKEEKWRIFRRKITYTLLPEGTPYPFDVK